MKTKKLAKQLLNTFRLSEDFDSDSDASDDENKTFKSGKKAVLKLIKEHDSFVIDEKTIRLSWERQKWLINFKTIDLV